MSSELNADPGRPASDHRKQPRRRGAALNAAIFQATLDELAESGYAKLSMERVAERARAGKASLYRRWPTRAELALDAVRHAMPDPLTPPDTGSLRGDLLASMRFAATTLAGPAGEALRGLISELLRDRPQALAQYSQGTWERIMLAIARRAADRGEIDPSAVTPRRLEVGQALLRQHFLIKGTPIPDEVIVEIVDEVLIPLLHAGAPVSQPHRKPR
ncbi:TetR/AcrR family transcriptional regulator [Actinopolymorpha alba]|uniref:TetR/AcrR family transcriptional regulator n=1 Tax=Actinopolymorpha alba TaxID=533267 RepID=UPI000382EB5C|nr:TetR/AcrR family transcriptional regulator [Actinopolymorpha alba]